MPPSAHLQLLLAQLQPHGPLGRLHVLRAPLRLHLGRAPVQPRRPLHQRRLALLQLARTTATHSSLASCLTHTSADRHDDRATSAERAVCGRVCERGHGVRACTASHPQALLHVGRHVALGLLEQALLRSQLRRGGLHGSKPGKPLTRLARPALPC